MGPRPCSSRSAIVLYIVLMLLAVVGLRIAPRGWFAVALYGESEEFIEPLRTGRTRDGVGADGDSFLRDRRSQRIAVEDNVGVRRRGWIDDAVNSANLDRCIDIAAAGMGPGSRELLLHEHAEQVRSVVAERIAPREAGTFIAIKACRPPYGERLRRTGVIRHAVNNGGVSRLRIRVGWPDARRCRTTHVGPTKPRRLSPRLGMASWV
jgi:hypothetical protein